MFKKKITEIQKAEIVLDYLQDELIKLCQNTETTQPTQDQISKSIVYVDTQISLQKKKLNILRDNAKK